MDTGLAVVNQVVALLEDLGCGHHGHNGQTVMHLVVQEAPLDQEHVLWEDSRDV